MLRVRLFGNGQIFDDDAEVRLRSRTWTLPLLAYLVLHRGDVIPRKRLAFLMWPDEAEEDALTKLRQNLHRLAQALPAAPANVSWISGGGHTVSWNSSIALEIDVAEFERLRSDEATLERAVTFYTGDLLSELEDDWIAVERERLRRLYHADLGTLIRTNRSRRTFDRAIHYARLLLASDPWHEETLRALISARYESGDAGGALADFDAFARRLREEMDASPMPETLALREAIARGSAIPTTLGNEETASGHAPMRSPFVGRGDELATLHGHWSRAARGNGGLVLLRGEAGIGKSRTVAELALIAEGEGARVIVGTTSSPERDSYQCLSSAIREALPLFAGVSIAPPLLAAVAELVPELRAYRSDIPQLVRLDPESERARLIDALVQMFSGLARPRPLVVILEDLHRAGTATIDAIATIVPRLVRSSILLIATYRPESIDRLHPMRILAPGSPTVAETIDLGPLSASDVALLVAAIGSEAWSSPERCADLLSRSDGNPLFVTELLRDAQHHDTDRTEIPASINALITERVASLTLSGRLLAEIAAVAGDAFTLDIVREIAGLANAELFDGLDELLDRHLVRESTQRDRYEYAFTHHLVRTAIYDGIEADARVRRHRRVARILEAETANDADERFVEIAFHYERGADVKNAAAHYARAARRASHVHANAEARDLVRKSLELDAPDEHTRFDLILLRSKMNARLGDADAESADLRQLAELAERRDADTQCSVLVHQIDLAYRQTERATETELIDRLAAIAIVNSSDRWQAAADEARSKRDTRAGQFTRALESASRALERYKRLGDDASSARMAGFGAYVVSCSGTNTSIEAKRLIADALMFAESAGDPETRISTLQDAAHAASLLSGDFAHAIDVQRMVLAMTIEIGDRAREAGSRQKLGLALWFSWEIDEAIAQASEALALCESLRLGDLRARAMGSLGCYLLDVDLEKARDWCRRASEAALEMGSMWTAIVQTNNSAESSWLLGDISAMAEDLARVDPMQRGFELALTHAASANRARYLRCIGDYDASLRILEELAAALPSESSIEAAELRDDLATTYLACGRIDEARLAIESSALVARGAARKRQDELRHHWLDACVHHAANESDDAKRALESAHDVYSERLARLRDPAYRASFAAMPLHRALFAARERDEWPEPNSPCVVAFPFAGSRSASIA